MTNEEKSQERYEAFVQNSSEGIWLCELDSPIDISLPPQTQIKQIFERAYMAEANLAMAKMYGFNSVKPLIGMRLKDIMIEDDADNQAYLRAFIASNYKLNDVESHELDNKGRDKYFRNSLVGIVKNGKIHRAWGTQRDVTEQRTANTALVQSEERLKLALEASSLGLWEWNVVTRQLYWSDGLKKLFGLKKRDAISFERYIEIIHPSDRELAQSVIQKSMETGESYQFEHRIIHPNGNEHWVLSRGQAYLTDGKPTRMVGTCLNIDKLKADEQQLQTQKKYLETLHQTAVQTSRGFYEHTEVLQNILDKACEIAETEHGYIYLPSTQSELAAQLTNGNFKQFQGHVVRVGEGLAGKVWATKKHINITDYDTWPHRQKDFPTNIFHAAISFPLIVNKHVSGVMTVAHSETKKRFSKEQIESLDRLADLASIAMSNARLFEEVQESEMRFRTMADTAPVMIWLSDTNKAITYVNKPWLDFTGQNFKQAVSEGWTEALHPEDASRAYSDYANAFDKQATFDMEYRLRRHDGAYRWVISTGVPRFSSDGTFQGYIGSCLDIHEVKRADELVLANTQLKNQRTQLLSLNKAKDDFIALASHQLRTPATAVKQYISMLINEFAGPLEPDQLQYLQIAYNSNERQLRIINDLLKTAQIDSSRYILDKRIQDIVPIIQQSIDDLEVAFDMKGQIVTFHNATVCDVDFDANEIKLVLINLLENASKYSYPKSEIAVSMKVLPQWVEISVADNGVGIDKKDRQRIFDKFTRIDNDLSDTVTGTGLGLYWVKKIISLHGGSIKVLSTLGKGSIFKIRLPL